MSLRLPAPVRAVYDFHENPHNLRLISGGSIAGLEIEAAPHAREGETFDVVLRRSGLVLWWKGVWEAVRPPGLLVDGAVRCPFAGWRHEHRFEQDGAETVMTDRVSFDFPVPVGPLVPLQRLIFRAVLERLFVRRHQLTLHYFRSLRPGWGGGVDPPTDQVNNPIDPA